MSENRSSELGTAVAGLVAIVVLIAVVYTLTAAQFSARRDLGTPEQTSARIAPEGSVRLAGAEAVVSSPASASLPAPADEGPGAAIYNKACTTCHASGAAGAPRLADKAAWKHRMAQGVDQLLHTAIDGKGAMPPRGTCMDCSDEDLTAAIEYMLVQVGFEPAAPTAPSSARILDGSSAMGGASGLGGMSGMTGESADVSPAAPTAVEGDASTVDMYRPLN